jgi:hypothetical protein
MLQVIIDKDKVRIRANNERTDTPDIERGELHHRDSEYLVVKVDGTQHATARWEQTRIPTMFHVYEIIKPGDKENTYLANHLFKFQARKNTPYRVYRDGMLVDSYSQNG